MVLRPGHLDSTAPRDMRDERPSEPSRAPLVLRRYRTVFERFPPLGPRGAYLFWASMFAVVTTTVFGVSWGTYDDPAFRRLCVFQAAGLLTVPLVVKVAYEILVGWASQLDHFIQHDRRSVADWLLSETRFVQGSRAMLSAGVLLGILGVLAHHASGFLPSIDTLPGAVGSATIFASATVAGMALYAMYRMSRVIWRLGTIPGARYVVHSHRFGILSTGTALFRVWVLIGCVWAIYVASAVVGFSGTEMRELWTLPPMWLLAYPTFPFIVGSFLVSQFPLHRRMVEYKRDGLRRLDDMLDEMQPHSAQDVSGEVCERITFLERQKEQYRALPEWPFSGRALFGTGASSMVATAPLLVAQIAPEWVSSLLSSVADAGVTP